MQEAMFTGLFGALTTEHRMNNVANNLANVNTHGFKRSELAFKDTMIRYAHDEIREPLANVRSKPLFPDAHLASRVRIAVAENNFVQGAMQTTGNPLDVAISGEGFFRINSPLGQQYTRNGSFVMDSTGQLVTKQGWQVLGDGGGGIVIPEGTRDIHIAPDGRVFADSEEVGTIAVVGVEDMTQMEHLGKGLYRAREGAVLVENNALAESFDDATPDNPNVTRLEQGFLETSNVEVVTEMVNMIEVQRHFEALQKVMQTSDSIDRETISKVARAK